MDSAKHQITSIFTYSSTDYNTIAASKASFPTKQPLHVPSLYKGGYSFPEQQRRYLFTNLKLFKEGL
jgi:hypothetical protein